MKTEVHRVVLSIIDTDHIGADGVRDVIENSRYPNHCIAPRVVAIDTRGVDWGDDHPLNKRDTKAAEFARMFSDGRDAEIARLTAELERVRNVGTSQKARTVEGWRREDAMASELLAARRELHRLAHGEAIEGDGLCSHEIEAANLRQELAAARAVPADVESALMHAVGCGLDAQAAMVLRTAIARAITDADAVGEFIDRHAKRLCEQAGHVWNRDDEEAQEWAGDVHDVLNHLRADDTGAVHDGRTTTTRATVGWLLAKPRCSCTHEAGDSRCDAHPTCSECGDSTLRNVDDCADHCQVCASQRRGDVITDWTATCQACKARGPLPKGGER